MTTMKRINTEGIAALLGYSRRHVTEVITKRPDFPPPVIATSSRNRWWDETHVLRWVREVSQAA